MVFNPRGKVLVLSDVTSAQIPIVQAFQALSFQTEALPLRNFDAASEVPCAVVIVQDGVGLASLDALLGKVSKTWDTPILVACHGASTMTTPIAWLEMGALRIPESLTGEDLDHSIESARAIHELVSQLNHHRRLLQAAPVGVFEITDGHLTYVNDYLLHQTGYTMEELQTLPIEQLVIPDDRSRLAEAIADIPLRPSDAPPSVYRFLTATGQTFVGEVRSMLSAKDDHTKIKGTIRDITQETRIAQLHRIVLELTEVILAEQDIDRILQLVLDTIVEYSGFHRALLTLYDLSIPVPFDGPVYKTMSSGLTPEEQAIIMGQEQPSIEQRRAIYSDRFKLGLAYYIPHDEALLSDGRGISGTIALDGWHPDDYLFIPLRGAGGIIGSISVDDPADHQVPTAASIEPVAFLANFAAFAVERVFKMKQLHKQAGRLRELAALGKDLAMVDNERALCEITAKRVQRGMNYDVCGIYLLDGVRFVHEAVSIRPTFPKTAIPSKGSCVVSTGPGINRWVLQHGEPAIIPDVSKDDIYAGPPEAIKSYIALPIIGRRHAIGVVYAASQQLSAFGDQDREILSTVASHLATALSAIRRQDALNRIFAFGQQLVVASTELHAIKSTLNFLVVQFDFQLSSIFMKQPDGSLVAHSVGETRGRPRKEAEAENDEVTGVVEWVASHNQTLMIPDTTKDTRYSTNFSSTQAELAVPILFDGELLGVIDIQSSQVNFFDEQDSRLIELVANQLATALANITSQVVLREQAVRDPLTGLFNRHYFNSIIAAELSRSDRYERPLALMMIDVDGFRAVNNTLGHLRGDDVLQNVARMIECNVRDSDRVIRYGGDEFLVFMPETDSHEDALHVAHRLREGVRSVLVGTDADERGLVLGLSIGIYSRQPGEKKTLEGILEEVDRRMYADKRMRNADRANDYRC